MNVYCANDECKWNNEGECNRGEITLDYENQCEDFESYLDTEEWRKPYWKRMHDHKTGQPYRVLFYGKEIELKGERFFVDTNSKYANVTEEKTGLGCGIVQELESCIDRIIEYKRKNDLPPLETLPIGEYDKKTGKAIPPQRGGF